MAVLVPDIERAAVEVWPVPALLSCEMLLRVPVNSPSVGILGGRLDGGGKITLVASESSSLSAKPTAATKAWRNASALW